MKVTRYYSKLTRTVTRLSDSDLREAVFDYLDKHGQLSNRGASTFTFEWIDTDSGYDSGVELDIIQEFEVEDSDGQTDDNGA